MKLKHVDLNEMYIVEGSEQNAIGVACGAGCFVLISGAGCIGASCGAVCGGAACGIFCLVPI